MIADIFYPIFILMITVLAYLNVWGFRTDIFTKAFPWVLGGLQLPPDPQLLSFLALQKIDAPIFFLYYPLVNCHLSIPPCHVAQIGTSCNW